jgi:rubrerythrin
MPTAIKTTGAALRGRLLRALALALAGHAAGCCQVTESAAEVREADSPANPWPADATCASRCQRAPSCVGGVRLASCTLAGAPGSRVAACVFESTDCPTRPGLWGDCGRRCDGATVEGDLACDDPLGALFVHLTALEAASVPAFEALADDLAAHGAPAPLRRAARRAAADERRHARLMGALAADHGAAAPTVRPPARSAPSLLALARDNAVEGCVRETFGALVALWQAERAGDPRVRAAMRSVARDELRHAALGWRIDAWAEALLDPPQREEVARAKRAAVAEVRAELGPAHASAVERAGVPSHQEALRLLAHCEALVWSRGAA